MGSVINSWGGKCKDHQIQEELITALFEFGEIINSYSKKVELEKGFAFYNNKVIKGNKLLSLDIFENLKNKYEFADLNEDIILYGVSFELPDYRYLYAENRFDLIFIRSENPELDGLIVSIEDEKECQFYTDPLISKSKFYIHKPLIHLRYDYENWLTDLFSWIKKFYSFDLYYDGYIKKLNEIDFIEKETMYEKLKIDFIEEMENQYENYLYSLFENGNFKKAKEFIESGIKIKYNYIFDFAFIMVSIENQREDLVELLIKSGYNINIKNNEGETPLMLSSKYCSKKLVKLLLDYKANIKDENNKGETALMLAEKYENNEVVELLKEYL